MRVMDFRSVYSVRKHARFDVRLRLIQEIPKAIIPPTTSTQVSNPRGPSEIFSSLKIRLRLLFYDRCAHTEAVTTHGRFVISSTEPPDEERQLRR